MPHGRRAWNHPSAVSDLETATNQPTAELCASAAATARSAAARAGVEIRLLDSLTEFEAASRLVARIWDDEDPKAPAALLRALSHAGNFIAGAFSERELVGVSIAFFGREGDQIHLHSHITGIDPRLQNRSLGFALKQFQRSWALAHGAESIHWTADPLVRRNLYFNLYKLGATVVAYHPDFYGPLLDGVNGPGESDRVLLHWELASPRVVQAADGRPVEPAAESGATIVRPRADGFPDAELNDGEALLVWIPDDVVSLRQSDPAKAEAWRGAVRLAVSSALADGYRGEAITRDGWLVLSR
jgi:predicted GNAT superfamily acetyltransferase